MMNLTPDAPGPEQDPSASPQPPRVLLLGGNPGMNFFLGLWFCGYGTGLAASLASHHPESSETEIGEVVGRAVAEVQGDPLFVENVREDVNRHIAQAAGQGGDL